MSNFYILESRLHYKGHSFNTSEQAYQWQKAVFHKKYNAARKVLQARTPEAQKGEGRKVKTNKKWDISKRNFMTQILKQKLKCSKAYRRCLRESGSQTLVEDTADEFWGRGENGRGRNILGTIHCYIRACVLDKR